VRTAVRSGQRIPPVLIEVLRDDIEAVSQALHSRQSQANGTRLRDAAVAFVACRQRNLVCGFPERAVQITNGRRDGICVGPKCIGRAPVAAGVFYSSLGWSLRPEVSALLMSASSIIVAVNAVILRRSEKELLL